MYSKDKLEELKTAAHAAESVYADAVDSRADRETWDSYLKAMDVLSSAKNIAQKTKVITTT